MFKPQIEFFKQKYRTVAVDLLGHGESESLKSGNYLDAHCQRVLEVLTVLNVEKAIVVGLSYGGIVAQHFTIKHPEKVSEMILIDTYANLLPNDLKEVKLGILGVFMAFAPWFPTKVLRSFFSGFQKYPLAYSELNDNFKNWRKKEVTKMLVQLTGMNILSELNKLEIPTLILVGGNNELIVGKSNEIKDNIKNSERIVVDNAADPSNLCQPDVVNWEMAKFIKEKILVP
jgi:pimeloyl-ACP methyl ester carboxylesterase